MISVKMILKKGLNTFGNLTVDFGKKVNRFFNNVESHG